MHMFPTISHSPKQSNSFTFQNLIHSLPIYFPKNTPKMAKYGKLTKLKSALKRLHSLSKIRLTSSNSIAAADHDSSTAEAASVSQGLHTVYVGKSRRQYLISTDIIGHPLFQELVDKTSGCEGEVNVACEVVLFEHLLWMLESSESQLESMDELVQFYSC